MSEAGPVLRRRFVQVGDRRAHVLTMGSGPPAVLVHSSPSDASYVVPHMRRLADRHTCFAFDTPGFGSSDALVADTVTVGALADALAANMAALGLPPCPVYGTHTGATIGLSLAAHHPERVTALVVDGLPLFTEAEQDDLFADYFRPLEIDEFGGHYARNWTRFRDQYIWFPWVRKRPDHHNEIDLGSPDAIDAWVRAFFRSGRTYAPAYRAACCYGEEGYTDARLARYPVFYTATESDMLYPHLDRLAAMPLPATHEIRRIGNDHAAKDALIAEVFDRWPARAKAPTTSFALAPGPGIGMQFCDLPHGQVLVRHAGASHAPPLLLLHDAPGSARALAQPGGLVDALSRDFLVIAPDLPGSGESDPLPASSALADWARAMADVCAEAGLRSVCVYGVGAGASVALALAARHASLVDALVLRGLALPDAAERAEMRARYAPPIAIEPDGAHWYRTWSMLRDQQIWFPWYDRRAARLRRQPADFGAESLHERTFEVMKQRADYHALLDAVFDADASALLDAVRAPLARCDDPRVPFSYYDDRVAAARPDALALPAVASDHADAVAAFARNASRPRRAAAR